MYNDPNAPVLREVGTQIVRPRKSHSASVGESSGLVQPLAARLSDVGPRSSACCAGGKLGGGLNEP